MGRLTIADNWAYVDYVVPSADHIRREADKPGSWTHLARTFLPPSGDLMELGCAPGFCSAALVIDSDRQPHGVDFSPQADVYLKTLEQAGKQAHLIYGDLFKMDRSRQYDVVTSFGLVEHFYDDELLQLLRLHDELLKPGGILVIEVPNFNGFQNVWHRFFDKPAFLRHNIKVMKPETFDLFKLWGYTSLYCDYVGGLEVWGDSGFYTGKPWQRRLVRELEFQINKYSQIISKRLGALSGRHFAPALLYVARKPG